MERLNAFSSITTRDVIGAIDAASTPAYLYDEALIKEKCAALMAMPNAFGLSVRFAMKANSTRAILRLIHEQGLLFDASSLNEARRAVLAGIPHSAVILTTQETYQGSEMDALQSMIKLGMKYNVCSLRQLHMIGNFASANGTRLAMRVHPGVGSGETVTRNTGDKYSCFGVHLTDVPEALQYANDKGIVFDHVHVHIGSGTDPAAWHDNIDRELGFIDEFFPDATTVSFGGGLREARMPGEVAADIQALGAYAKEEVEAFYHKTGRKLHMEIEPGTYVVANAGYALTTVVDVKRTGPDGLLFIVADGGMEINARPLLYGSPHPFYVVGRDGQLRSSEFAGHLPETEAVVVGTCCESGDSQCLNDKGENVPRRIAVPEIGDFVVIGGVGAYCSSMTPMNYNSHVQIPELLLGDRGQLTLIRKRQTLEQILENEL